MKETREGVVKDKERNTGIRDNVYFVNKVMDCNEEDSSEFSNPKPKFLEIYKDLLFSEQNNSSGMFSTSHVLNTDTSTSHNASNSSIRSTCASIDLSLDTHDEEILNIVEELQCSADQRIVEECTEHRHRHIQTHLLLIMLAIAVLEVHVCLQICHWIHMMRRF